MTTFHSDDHEPAAIPAELAARCATIELLAVDVDGVLTDGGIVVDDHGVESKRFFVRDGLGFTLWHRAGKRSAIVSGRSAEVVDRRAAELKIHRVAQGINDKASALRALLEEVGLWAWRGWPHARPTPSPRSAARPISQPVQSEEEASSARSSRSS